MEDSVVRNVSIYDILNSKSNLPFTTRSAWRQIQLDCPDLRRVHSYLIQGTRPSKKLTNIRDVKRYLSSVSIASDGHCRSFLWRKQSLSRGPSWTASLPPFMLNSIIRPAISFKWYSNVSTSLWT